MSAKLDVIVRELLDLSFKANSLGKPVAVAGSRTFESPPRAIGTDHQLLFGLWAHQPAEFEVISGLQLDQYEQILKLLK
jgi:hypothetical protein